jgi:hypothetical protein
MHANLMVTDFRDEPLRFLIGEDSREDVEKTQYRRYPRIIRKRKLNKRFVQRCLGLVFDTTFFPVVGAGHLYTGVVSGPPIYLLSAQFTLIYFLTGVLTSFEKDEKGLGAGV